MRFERRHLLTTSIVVVVLFFTVPLAAAFRRVCYYYSPDILPVEKLNLTVCTHIIYYGVHCNSYNLTFSFPPKDAVAIDSLKQARTRHGFQLMTVLGGSLTAFIGSEKNMTNFASAAAAFLRSNKLDGLDFDWEFPGKKYKEGYAALLKAVRKAFDTGQPRLLLSMAATGVELLVLESYDVPVFAETLDFLDIMGYDYRSWEDKFYLTAHHSPLYATKCDIIYENTLNLNWSANYFAYNGMPRNKIVLGLPAYAHGWQLLTTVDHGLCAVTVNVAKPAEMNYYDVCAFVKKNGTTRVWDTYAQSPYAYNGKRWYSFDDLESIAVKVSYLKRYGFGGTMVWSLIGDADFGRQCGTGTDFPIHSRITDLLS